MPTSNWPALPRAAWQDTYATLHMYTQVIGKMRLAWCAPENQFWHVPFYLTVRGLTTSPMPYGDRTIEIDFDFIDHALVIRASDGRNRSLPLIPRTVAEFYDGVCSLLGQLDVAVKIWDHPVEIPNPIPFSADTQHCSYDADSARRFFEVLRRVDVVFKQYRGTFSGKSSPVHFFWGSFDLAVTRFSGRAAPPRPDADYITRLSYNEEVMSLGFWPGTGDVDAAFYAYAAPEPAGFADEKFAPAAAYYHKGFKELILPYEAVRASADPAREILTFADSAYAAAARLAKWDRAALERTIPA
ncbi:MAG TPA: DUF5996 family protein [Polyangia bacterium]|jgi:hypothetical protein